MPVAAQAQDSMGPTREAMGVMGETVELVGTEAGYSSLSVICLRITGRFAPMVLPGRLGRLEWQEARARVMTGAAAAEEAAAAVEAVEAVGLF